MVESRNHVAMSTEVGSKLRDILEPYLRIDNLTSKQREKLVGYILVAPSVILILAVIGYPLVYNIYLSFMELPLNPTDPLEFVGLKHYQELLSSSRFWNAMMTTGIYVVCSTAFSTIGGLAVALLFTRKLPAKGYLRSLVLIPYITPLIVVAVIWQWMLNPRNGVILYLLGTIEIISGHPDPLANPTSGLVTLIIFDTWRHLPFAFLFFTARLQAIPESLFEAAKIDGAGRFARFKDIILPELRDTIILVVMLRAIWNVHKFEQVWLLTTFVETLSVFTYVTAFSTFAYGRAAAIAVVIVTILMTLASVYMKYILKW